VAAIFEVESCTELTLLTAVQDLHIILAPALPGGGREVESWPAIAKLLDELPIPSVWKQPSPPTPTISFSSFLLFS
jgi:hypothetical protein